MTDKDIIALKKEVKGLRDAATNSLNSAAIIEAMLDKFLVRQPPPRSRTNAKVEQAMSGASSRLMKKHKN